MSQQSSFFNSPKVTDEEIIDVLKRFNKSLDEAYNRKEQAGLLLERLESRKNKEEVGEDWRFKSFRILLNDTLMRGEPISERLGAEIERFNKSLDEMKVDEELAKALNTWLVWDRTEEARMKETGDP